MRLKSNGAFRLNIPKKRTDFFLCTSQDVELNDLQPSTTYQITVAAYTIKGDGASSVPAFAKTLAKLPDPPHIFQRPSSSDEVIIRWRTLATGVESYKLRYGKSLQRLRGRDQASLKMKEMTFLPRTMNHAFRELSELLSVVFVYIPDYYKLLGLRIFRQYVVS